MNKCALGCLWFCSSHRVHSYILFLIRVGFNLELGGFFFHFSHKKTPKNGRDDKMKGTETDK